MGEYYDIIVRYKPGITGLWQISGRSDVTFENRLDMDITYHKDHSIIKDLKIRKWTCPKCGSIHDRDINAAKNILSKGIEILTKDVTHPDSLFMLGSLGSSSKKPPLL